MLFRIKMQAGTVFFVKSLICLQIVFGSVILLFY